MKTFLCSGLATLMVCGVGCRILAANSVEFYVAPSGDDANAGTTQKPLATLEAARDAARKAGAGPHRIVVMPGEYFLERPVELDARDNGLTIEAATTNAT